MEAIKVGRHLVIDPRVCFGKLTFEGTRVPVQTVLTYLSKGYTIERILRSWPYLKREAVEEAIRIAAVAWPELMRRDPAAKLRRLAETLHDSHANKSRDAHEPAGSR